MVRLAFVSGLTLAAAGCAAISAEDDALLTREIDCARAAETVEAIREARPTDIDRARVLASSLTPAGLALGVATSDLYQRERLLSGAYDEELTARMREIGDLCDFPVPELEEEDAAAS